ncbi:MAG TPA: GGDEF domain-containing protein [Euzebyales bacterium]
MMHTEGGPVDDTMDGDAAMEERTTDQDAVLHRLAAHLAVPADALDAFVFRRVDGGRMVHLGGRGRAVGWAGVVDVTLNDEQLLHEAWTTARPVRHRHAEARRVFGPYWARSAVVVPLPPDHLVVLGGTGRIDAPDEIMTLAGELVDHIGEISPAKRLADELEVLHAVRRIAQIAQTDVQAAADDIVAIAAGALSCELAALWMPEPEMLAVVDTTSGPTRVPAAADALAPAMARLLADRDTLPHCQQDNATRPLPSPLGADSPVVAWYAVPIAGPPDGLLLLCHTTAKPRGFTLLCQQVGRNIAEAAATPLATALAQERLAARLAQVSVEARQDPLTGLANRRVWLEAVAELSADRRRHEVVVAMLDVDGLKQINDELGHRVGDDVLRAVAHALQRSVREGDVAARLGGDEFAVLLRDIDDAAARPIIRRITEAIDQLPPFGARRASASLGWAHVAADGHLDDALRAADRAMYAAKRTRAAATTASGVARSAGRLRGTVPGRSAPGG